MAKRILIAPASFKGSLSAPAVAEVIWEVLRSHLPPEVMLDVCPIADGGDDTLAVLQASDPGFVVKERQVTGPVADMTVTAHYLVHAAKRLVVIEAAQTHGLKLLPSKGLAPLDATSYGVGELIGHVISAEKPDAILVALGGSASTDGGMGALQALGVIFRDAQNQIIQKPMNGRLLAQLQRIEWMAHWPFAGQLCIATDVINPLLGPQGTATVFAPQKGATPEQCRQLEASLSRLCQLLKNLTGQNGADWPGAGAAGGLAYGLRHLPRSGMVSGSQWVAEQLGLPDKIHRADLIITGEGRLDPTSLGGKGTGNLLACASEKPVMVVCGQVDAGLEALRSIRVFPLVQAEESPEMAMAHPKGTLQRVLMENLLPAVQACLHSTG